MPHCFTVREILTQHSAAVVPFIWRSDLEKLEDLRLNIEDRHARRRVKRATITERFEGKLNMVIPGPREHADISLVLVKVPPQGFAWWRSSWYPEHEAAGHPAMLADCVTRITGRMGRMMLFTMPPGSAAVLKRTLHGAEVPHSDAMILIAPKVTAGRRERKIVMQTLRLYEQQRRIHDNTLRPAEITVPPPLFFI